MSRRAAHCSNRKIGNILTCHTVHNHPSSSTTTPFNTQKQNYTSVMGCSSSLDSSLYSKQTRPPLRVTMIFGRVNNWYHKLPPASPYVCDKCVTMTANNRPTTISSTWLTMLFVLIPFNWRTSSPSQFTHMFHSTTRTH